MNYKSLFCLVYGFVLCNFAIGSTWEGSDDFSSGISPSKWTVYQNYKGQMTANAANGHASFLTQTFTNTQQSAIMIWNGTPAVSDDWTMECFGHNTASPNGITELKVHAMDTSSYNLNPSQYNSLVLKMNRGDLYPSGEFQTRNYVTGVGHDRQLVQSTNTDFGLRLIHRGGISGTVEAWYDSTGAGKAWVMLDSMSMTSFSPSMTSTNTFTLYISSETYYGSITEGQVFVDNFALASMPQITTQPLPRSVATGGSASFSALATGTSPLNYQWRFNATNIILNATNSLLSLTNVQPANTGFYDVVVTNAYGSVTSIVVNLSILIGGGGTWITNGLVAYYKFDGNANDASGNAINGTCYNVSLTNNRFGARNTAYHFDGIDSYIYLGNSDLLNFQPNDQFTIGAWFKPDGFGSGYAGIGSIVVKSPSGGSGAWNYGFDLIQSYNYVLWGGLNNVSACVSTNVVSVGSWSYGVLTYSNSNWNIYLNGIQIQSSTGYSITTSSGGVSIGRKGDAPFDYFNGDIDDVRIYNRALSASENAQLFMLESHTLTGKVGVGGVFNLSMNTQAGNPFVVQCTTNLISPVQWQSVTTNTADTNGNYIFSDTNINRGQKYYRIILP